MKFDDKTALTQLKVSLVDAYWYLTDALEDG